MNRPSYTTSLIATLALVVLVSCVVSGQLANPIDPAQIPPKLNTDLITNEPLVPERIVEEAKKRKGKKNGRVIWEYKGVSVDVLNSNDVMDTWESVGKDGWELVTIGHDQKRITQTAYFKRTIK